MLLQAHDPPRPRALHHHVAQRQGPHPVQLPRVHAGQWLAGGADGVALDVPSYVLERVHPPPAERGVWPGEVTELLASAGAGGLFDSDGSSDAAWREPLLRRTGVVQRVDAARRALLVRWLGPSGEPCGPGKTVGTDWGLDQTQEMGETGDLVIRLFAYPTVRRRRRPLPPSERASRHSRGWDGWWRRG